MKIRVDFHELHSIRTTPKTIKYMAVLYTQPWWRTTVAKAYHAYDMNRVVHWAAHKIERRYGTIEGEPFTMPHCALQDERCFTLSRRGRIDLTEVELTTEQHEQISSSRPAGSSPSRGRRRGQPQVPVG